MSSLVHTIVWFDQSSANIHFVQNVKEKGLSFNSSDFRETNASYT